MFQFKPISISLSPNTEKDDLKLAFKTIFQIWKWKRGRAIEKIENEFKNYLGAKYAFSFNSARSALFVLLLSLDLEKNSEVLTQAFTCNAAINPILWAGLNPKYVDCQENDFNISIQDLKEKINKKTKVLIVQHTFGLPADMDKILEISKNHNLILIEDCAHSLGAEYKGKKVGTFGKASIFSFSRDKVISSVYGGMLVTNDDFLAQRIKNHYQKIKQPSYFWIFQQLLHPLLMNWFVLPIYNFINLGKLFLILSQVFHLLSKAVQKKEKKGMKPFYFPKKMSNALAVLALHQFQKLEKFNRHREKVASFYYQKLKNTSYELPFSFPERKNIFLRFTVKHPKSHLIIFELWHKYNILIGDWYTSPIAPSDTSLKKMRYKLGSCPVAEKLSKISFNLPTHINISEKEAQKIVDVLKNLTF